MHQMKFENSVNEEGSVPTSTALVAGVPQGRVPVREIETKIAAFLRGAGYAVTHVSIEIAEVPSE